MFFRCSRGVQTLYLRVNVYTSFYVFVRSKVQVRRSRGTKSKWKVNTELIPYSSGKKSVEWIYVAEEHDN
jgi:hypothetical protein